MVIRYQNGIDAKEDRHEDFPGLQNSPPADCIVHHRSVSASLWTNLTKARIISHLKTFYNPSRREKICTYPIIEEWRSYCEEIHAGF
jgi:hypothetical protein